MPASHFRALLALTLLSLASCTESESQPDAATTDDGGAADAGRTDAGTSDAGDADAGEVDAGELDGGELDGGTVDGGELDGGELDGGEVDAGELDAGELDAGELDGGDVDAGELDAGALDAGEADAGIDECLTNNGGCHANAQCTNAPGGRTCACLSGYEGDGLTCADVDECAMNNGGCDVNAQCTNTPGARTCACLHGYEGDGVTCESRIMDCLSLANALNTAQAQGITRVTLGSPFSDATLCATAGISTLDVQAGAMVTLDLAGRSLTLNAAPGQSAIRLGTGALFTITDSAGGGLLTANGGPAASLTTGSGAGIETTGATLLLRGQATVVATGGNSVTDQWGLGREHQGGSGAGVGGRGGDSELAPGGNGGTVEVHDSARLTATGGEAGGDCCGDHFGGTGAGIGGGGGWGSTYAVTGSPVAGHGGSVLVDGNGRVTATGGPMGPSAGSPGGTGAGVGGGGSGLTISSEGGGNGGALVLADFASLTLAGGRWGFAFHIGGVGAGFGGGGAAEVGFGGNGGHLTVRDDTVTIIGAHVPNVGYLEDPASNFGKYGMARLFGGGGASYGGAAGSAGSFTLPPLNVTGIAPSDGPVSGGTTITVTGTGFMPHFLTGATVYGSAAVVPTPASVTVGGVSATNITVLNGTTLTAVVPPGTAGVNDVTVTRRFVTQSITPISINPPVYINVSTTVGSQTLDGGFSYF